jgi:hypothetical protein
VDVTPDYPVVSDDLTCSITTDSDDADGDSVTYSYAWYKDNVLQGAITGDTVDSSLTADGEKWRCEVTPNDGTEDGTTGQDDVVVGAPYLSGGQVSPTSGYTSTGFTYSVTYTDNEGNAPTSITVTINSGTPEEMTEEDSEDTDYTDGKVYNYTIAGSTLGVGTGHTFQFAATDSTGNDAVGDIGVFTGPTVNTKGGGGGGGGAGGGDVKPPRISEVTVSNITKTGADISWKTQEKSTSQVEYWASPAQYSDLDEERVITHLVSLTDLNPGTTYTFRVHSRDNSENLGTSEDYTFDTLGDPAVFTVSDLTISPSEAVAGEEVSVSVQASNDGDTEGICRVSFSINGDFAGTRAALLAGGAGETLTFTFTPDSAGSYEITADDLTGKITVSEPVATPASSPDTGDVTTSQATPTPATTDGNNWWLKGGIIAAATIVAALLVVFGVFRRRNA